VSVGAGGGDAPVSLLAGGAVVIGAGDVVVVGVVVVVVGAVVVDVPAPSFAVGVVLEVVVGSVFEGSPVASAPWQARTPSTAAVDTISVERQSRRELRFWTDARSSDSLCDMRRT
jgi:hypothetical protein